MPWLYYRNQIGMSIGYASRPGVWGCPIPVTSLFVAIWENSVRMISGAILLVGAEQAFSHSLLIGFPNAQVAQEVLYPASLVLLCLGGLLMSWGLVAGEFRNRNHCEKKSVSS